MAVKQSWASEMELVGDFEVKGFAGPYVNVVRKSDGRRGRLQYTHRPRAYFGWAPS
jgi:hypothetical protein